MSIVIWGAAAAPVTPPPTNFFTNFSTQENPLAEGGGKYLNGLADGLDWNNGQVTANGWVGAADNFASRYADNLSCVNPAYRTFTHAQFVEATMYWAPGYVANGGSHELETLLCWKIINNVATGYECSVGVTASGALIYGFVVSWQGTLGDYVKLWSPAEGIGSYTNAPVLPTSGVKLRAEITVGGLITLKQGGVLLGSVTDTQWTDGQPGIGSWPVDGAIKTSAGFRDFTAGNL